MNREEYLHLRENEDYLTLCFHYWEEHKTDKNKNLSYREFMEFFGRYLENLSFAGRAESLLRQVGAYFDAKYEVVKLQTTKEDYNRFGQLDTMADQTIKVF